MGTPWKPGRIGQLYARWQVGLDGVSHLVGRSLNPESYPLFSQKVAAEVLSAVMCVQQSVVQVRFVSGHAFSHAEQAALGERLHSLQKESQMSVSPWKSGPSGQRNPSEISLGFSPGGRSSSSDCIFPQAVQALSPASRVSPRAPLVSSKLPAADVLWPVFGKRSQVCRDALG